MEGLDDVDLKILRILQEDARTPFSKIASSIGVSEATVHLRVQKLKRLGIIKGFKAIIDPSKVGKGLTAIVLLKADPMKFKEVLKQVALIDDVYEVYDVTGEYYAVLKIRASNRESLVKIIDRIGEIEGVTSTQTMLVLRVIKEEEKLKF
ncbi:MAG: Lrp/AsnC family transcriptional regulator [Candidatus Nezhaarchaeota archaeon]|nr:Lrp/AsnC family transcriptional regulator [Candidatus Nezhaarchaeota archaeon]MCX8141810.1 Lrp/AsnC family transcriptional regulator [Candidatus Nezhaarchaeota archaeon]MDW8050409.1 Lrp/AsnC family transcriptional regulator [Nitrososphaerota archaeon]